MGAFSEDVGEQCFPKFMVFQFPICLSLSSPLELSFYNTMLPELSSIFTNLIWKLVVSRDIPNEIAPGIESLL